MKIGALCVVVFFLAGCAGTGNSPLENQPGTRFNTSGGNSSSNKPNSQGQANVLVPAVATEPVSDDADDPAIWVNRIEPDRSLILGTDKIEKVGGLYVFNLNGKIVQKIADLDRPNNVDVEYDFQLGPNKIDLAVVTERKKSRLKIYSINQTTGKLDDVSGKTDILGEEEGPASEPMGVALFRREDGETFAIVAPKSGGKTNYLAQYRLVANGDSIDLKLVRRFGDFSGLTSDGEGEIEAICVDDQSGIVFYSDERVGIRKYWADPDQENSSKQLAMFGQTGYQADREGLAIYGTSKTEGFLLSVDQIEKNSRIHVYDRNSSATKSPANKLVKIVTTSSDSTDGMDATSRDLGSKFPAGIVVMMDSANKRFLIYDWRDMEQAIKQR